MWRRPSATDISKVVSGTGDEPGASETFKEDAKINFGLVTSVEWIELGSQVLVMPGIFISTSAGVSVSSAPGSGADNANGSRMVPMSGFEGFVGVVFEVVPGTSVGAES
ncbi:hypothetical protein N7462_003599 [Penicillium macrosclerotiorum]|uniref:uncharacterized protein n=1 Tax=Penicillium macrosclerotiorum TaxID=303699 RepID=UPI002546D221|nr:uncharacterized protein N7462_003599 [Penicillium macrosclerotiorum]KAJ5689207.1 hypothetical protein N7462_003599 [Penicillium macrosclerotiorum]